MEVSSTIIASQASGASSSWKKGHAARRLVKLCLQKPVDGRGLAARHLGKPLRGAASRRSQLRLEPQRVKQPQNAGHDRRLARAGAAGHDQKLPEAAARMALRCSGA